MCDLEDQMRRAAHDDGCVCAGLAHDDGCRYPLSLTASARDALLAERFGLLERDAGAGQEAPTAAARTCNVWYCGSRCHLPRGHAGRHQGQADVLRTSLAAERERSAALLEAADRLMRLLRVRLDEDEQHVSYGSDLPAETERALENRIAEQTNAIAEWRRVAGVRAGEGGAS